MEKPKITAKEMLIEQAQGLIDANKQVDMENADIAVQEQYRRNVETVVSVVSLLERY